MCKHSDFSFFCPTSHLSSAPRSCSPCTCTSTRTLPHFWNRGSIPSDNGYGCNCINFIFAVCPLNPLFLQEGTVVRATFNFKPTVGGILEGRQQKIHWHLLVWETGRMGKMGSNSIGWGWGGWGRRLASIAGANTTNRVGSVGPSYFKYLRK